MAQYVFYGKTLYFLKWQPETNECVFATDSVKMRLRILTSCKNRVKTSYKQEEGAKGGRDKGTKRRRDKETKGQRVKKTKSQRDKETKRGRDEGRRAKTVPLCHSGA